MNFVDRNYDTLALFMEKADLDEVLKCIRADCIHIPVGPLSRVLRSSSIGEALFSDYARLLDFAVFVNTINARLDDLEHLDFKEDDVVSFKNIMRSTASNLKLHGQKTFDKKACELQFFGQACELVLACPDDEWSFRLAARVKTAAMNGRILTLLPWEQLILECGALPGVRENCMVPRSLLKDAANCRDACNHFLNGVNTISDMRRICSHHSKSLLALDRTFTLELTFLDCHAEKRLADLVLAQALNMLPSLGSPMKLSHVIVAVDNLRASARVAACGPKVKSDIDGVACMLQSLQEGVSPANVAISRATHFFTEVLKRIENFCQFTQVASAEKGSENRVFFGCKALRMHFQACRDARTDGAVVPLKDLGVFRIYRWLLTESECAEADDWVQKALAAHSAGATLKITAGDANTNDTVALACVPVATSPVAPSLSFSGAASSSSAKPKAKGKAKSKSKVEPFVPDERLATKEDLMKFFRGKVTVHNSSSKPQS